MRYQARPADTSPEVWAMCRDRWCGMTPQQRFEEACQLTDDLTSIALAGIRATNPDWREERVRFELTCRRYGRDLAEAAFGSSAT